MQDRLLDELCMKKSEQISEIYILSVPMSVPQVAIEFPIYFHWILGQQRRGEKTTKLL